MADQTSMNPHKVVCSVPIELVFTDTDVKSSRTEHRIDHITDAWFEHHLLHSDISIMRFTPHRDLYSYFMGHQSSPEAYLEWHDKIYTTRGLKAPDRETVLRQKQKEFINMKNELLSKAACMIADIAADKSGDDPQKEKRLILENTGFTRYEKLADTFGTGKLRELGVFQK